jgi:hypothetical protein
MVEVPLTFQVPLTLIQTLLQRHLAATLSPNGHGAHVSPNGHGAPVSPAKEAPAPVSVPAGVP